MNQQLIPTMLRRMDLEEERRNKAEEKVHEAAEAGSGGCKDSGSF